MRDITDIIVHKLDGQSSKGFFLAVLAIEIQKESIRFLESKNFEYHHLVPFITTLFCVTFSSTTCHLMTALFRNHQAHSM